MSKRKTIIFSVIIAIVCFVLYMRPEMVERNGESYFVVARIDAGSGRNITILEDNRAFEISGWVYEITVGEQTVVQPTHWSASCRSQPASAYQLLTSKDGTVVGLVCKKRPHILELMHDFGSGETWPRPREYDGYEATLQRGRKLRDRLQKDHPESRLIFGSEVTASDYFDE